MDKLKIIDGMLTRGGRPFLLRGFGLGGWLLPEGYMWRFYTKCDRPRRIEALIERLCGAEYAEGFWRRYYSLYITERDIAFIAAQGFNSVRLAINSRHLAEPDYLGRVDDCVRWCEKYGIYAVLDMHGAPGGQTGQNIDDSERDIPELFTDGRNQDALTELWRGLARRYAGNAAVAGFDLLNEPIVKTDAQYTPQLLPLYLRLTAAIREIDPERIVIWEGTHWATDFSIFDALEPGALPDNLMLQFHKYWSRADRESLEGFFSRAERLRLPLYCGESGENNLEWYTTLFPMLEREGVSWCFWAYKKMLTPNSVSVFPEPARWPELIAHLDGGPAPERPREIFDSFLDCVEGSEFRLDVVRALDRRPPLLIPAEAFDACRVEPARRGGALFREGSGAEIGFFDGHTGEPDCRRYGGEPRPEGERMFVRLLPGDELYYALRCSGQLRLRIKCAGAGGLEINGLHAGVPGGEISVPADGGLTLRCTGGDIYLESLEVET